LFRLKRSRIDTLSEHVIFLHEEDAGSGGLGLAPLDRVRVVGKDGSTGEEREVQGILNLCREPVVERGEVGLSESAFADLGLPEASMVRAMLAAPPASVVRVREKLTGRRFERSDFDAILEDVVGRRYSKIELSMFVLACALRKLDAGELTDFTRAMVARGECLDFGDGPVADKHCIGGIPGNRTTMIIVPIVASLGVLIPKTSSRAITSPAGTADTMGVLAEVGLRRERMREVVRDTGGCIAWGGALDLAPADDVLITVERPMGIDTEAQMIASIMSKKKAAGATHVLIDIPVGPTAKVETGAAAASLGARFDEVARSIGLELEVVVTEVEGPIGAGVGPRLEALDVLAVLRRDEDAPQDLRDKSISLAAKLLESVGAVPPGEGVEAARQAIDSGMAARKFEEIVEAQGRRTLPPEAAFKSVIEASRSGRLTSIDCRGINALAKLAGAPAHPTAGVRILRKPGHAIARGEPLLEIHAQSEVRLEFAKDYASEHAEVIHVVE